MKKQCSICKLRRGQDKFYAAPRMRSGLSSYCRDCYKIWRKRYKIENKEAIREYDKAYAKTPQAKIYAKAYKRSDKYRNQQAEKRRLNPGYRNSYYTERCKRDPDFKLRMKLRTRIYVGLRQRNLTKKAGTLDLIGCSWNELKTHLEKQFQPWMTWDNHGEWHVDHIKP